MEKENISVTISSGRLSKVVMSSGGEGVARLEGHCAVKELAIFLAFLPCHADWSTSTSILQEPTMWFLWQVYMH